MAAAVSSCSHKFTLSQLIQLWVLTFWNYLALNKRAIKKYHVKTHESQSQSGRVRVGLRILSGWCELTTEPLQSQHSEPVSVTQRHFWGWDRCPEAEDGSVVSGGLCSLLLHLSLLAKMKPYKQISTQQSKYFRWFGWTQPLSTCQHFKAVKNVFNYLTDLLLSLRKRQKTFVFHELCVLLMF